jgi:hypothetical protein
MLHTLRVRQSHYLNHPSLEQLPHDTNDDLQKGIAEIQPITRNCCLQTRSLPLSYCSLS